MHRCIARSWHCHRVRHQRRSGRHTPKTTATRSMEGIKLLVDGELVVAGELSQRWDAARWCAMPVAYGVLKSRVHACTCIALKVVTHASTSFVLNRLIHVLLNEARGAREADMTTRGYLPVAWVVPRSDMPRVIRAGGCCWWMTLIREVRAITQM